MSDLEYKKYEKNIEYKNKDISNLIPGMLVRNDSFERNKSPIFNDIISSIIHEISQPLTAIISYSAGCRNLLRDNLDIIKDIPGIYATIEKIFMLAEHAGNTVFSIRKLMVDGGLLCEKKSINDIVNEAVSILNYESMDFGMNTRLSLMPYLPDVRVNKTHIMQVILNLARNSMEAMKFNRPIGHDSKPPELIIRTRKVNQGIVVHVIDKGPGIPAHIQDQILETCFSTKSTGLGVGLRICRLLIETHGGQLSVRKNRKNGAWFSFTLPIPEDDCH